MAPNDEPRPDWPSLDVIFEAVLKRSDEQQHLIGTLDTKAGFSLGAASILTGGVGTLSSGLATSAANTEKPMKSLNLGLFELSLPLLVTLMVLLVLLVYLVVVYTAFQAYKLRRYATSPNLTKLVENYLTRDAQLTKGAIISSLVRGYEENQGVISEKTKWVDRTVRAIMLEASLVLAIGLIQVWMV